MKFQLEFNLNFKEGLNRLVLITNNSSFRKEDHDIRATILMEYENEEKKFSPMRSPLKLSSPLSTREFKFSIIHNEKLVLKDFDNFVNHYSQDYKEIDITQYQYDNFELQVKPSIGDRLLTKFTNENMFVDEDTEFVIVKEFDEKIFNGMQNGFSKDFKFKRNFKISKDDNDCGLKGEKNKILI